MTIRRIPVGDTFEKMSRHFPNDATPYPPPPPARPISFDSYRGNILDIDELHIGNIGNALTLNSPAAATSLAAVPAQIWQNSIVLPPNASRTVVMQARSQVPGNSRNLALGINSITTQEQAFGSLDADIKAMIEFGVGNDRNIAIVDVCQGLQLSIVASHVEVSGIYTLLSAINTVQPIMVGAQLGYGDRAASPVRPTFTSRYNNVAPTVSVNVIPPPFAREVYVSAIDMTTRLSVPSTVRFFGNLPFDLAQYTLAAGDNGWRPIPNGTTTVIIGNPAANPNNIQGVVMFGLAL